MVCLGNCRDDGANRRRCVGPFVNVAGLQTAEPWHNLHTPTCDRLLVALWLHQRNIGSVQCELGAYHVSVGQAGRDFAHAFDDVDRRDVPAVANAGKVKVATA